MGYDWNCVFWKSVRAEMTVQCLMEMKYYVESLYAAVKQEKGKRLQSQEMGSPEEETLQKEEFGHSEGVGHGNLPFPWLSVSQTVVFK